jgi:23S rRNA (adenine1618-N6)-methyltransferase
MSSGKNQQEKTRLHTRNKNRERYDLEALKHATPELADFVRPNKYGVDSVDFSNPVAVKLLNKALLNYYYGKKTGNSQMKIYVLQFPEELIIFTMLLIC